MKMGVSVIRTFARSALHCVYHASNTISTIAKAGT